jgi:ABC-type nitrate/sulfonate/bicarbonate transport system ATPase subunit
MVDEGTAAALELRGFVKHFGAVVAVGGIDLIVRRGEFFTLLGPSGLGKTTVLRLVAGSDRPTAFWEDEISRRCRRPGAGSGSSSSTTRCSHT